MSAVDRDRLGGELLRASARVVSLGNVGDLVGYHTSQFRLGIEVGRQPAVDINHPARQGEGVDVW